MNSLIQIVKLNETRSGISAKTQQPWQMQDAECLILDSEGVVDQVGVLMVPKNLMGKVALGTYMGSFALRANTRQDGGRKIEAVLTGLQPVTKGASGMYAPQGDAISTAPAKVVK